MDGDYQFDDIDTTSAPAPKPTQESVQGSGQRSGGHATEIFSKTIHAKFRTFYIDLKESSNGKFVKVSEKSHGRKTTIMMDEEDVAPFVEAMKEVQEKM